MPKMFELEGLRVLDSKPIETKKTVTLHRLLDKGCIDQESKRRWRRKGVEYMATKGEGMIKSEDKVNCRILSRFRRIRIE
jgi:hypothetical protein